MSEIREARARLGSRTLRRRQTKRKAMGHTHRPGDPHPWKAKRPNQSALLEERPRVRLARLLKEGLSTT